MIDFLLGALGKLNTLLTRLSATWAAKLDTLESRLTSGRASAMDTMLSALVWTGTKAGYLDCKMSDAGGIVPTSCPSLSMYVSADNLGFVAPNPMINVNNSAGYVANTLKTILDLTGRGALTFVGLENRTTTSKTARIKITLDGTVIFDATTASSLTTVGNLVRVLGWYDTVNNLCYGFLPLQYNTSLKIECAVSVTEDYAVRVGYQYFVR